MEAKHSPLLDAVTPQPSLFVCGDHQRRHADVGYHESTPGEKALGASVAVSASEGSSQYVVRPVVCQQLYQPAETDKQRFGQTHLGLCEDRG